MKLQLFNRSGLFIVILAILSMGSVLMAGNSISDIENNLNWEELAVRSAVNAKVALMCGITSWSDAGGMGTGLKKTIDAGLIEGPRIYPVGAFI